MIKELDHIGIAVKDLEKAIETYTKLLGVNVDHREKLPERKLEVAFLKIGNVMLELICPTSEESVVHKFLESKGDGLHHLCFKTDDVERTAEELKSQSFRLAQSPAKGAHGRIVAFLHPQECHGVLIELAQKT